MERADRLDPEFLAVAVAELAPKVPLPVVAATGDPDDAEVDFEAIEDPMVVAEDDEPVFVALADPLAELDVDEGIETV